MKDIPALCNDGKTDIELSSVIDQLSFDYDAENAEAKVRLSFRYDKHIKAYYRDVNGEKKYLDVSEGSEHRILISGFPGEKEIRVYVEKKYPLAILSVLIGFGSAVAVLIVMAYSNVERCYCKAKMA